jgi:protein-tyrosine phosphatase
MTANSPAHDARLVPLEGARNFRDLGGYAGDGGRRVRWRTVYRAGALSGLTEADVVHLQGLGIRSVIDLRDVAERSRAPGRLVDVPGIRHHEIPVGNIDAARNDHDPRTSERQVAFLEYLLGVRGGPGDARPGRSPSATAGGPRQALQWAERRWIKDCTGSYREALSCNREQWCQVIELLCHPDNRPAVVHCRAGKDRTGIACATLLAALGVESREIAADFALSNRYWAERELLQFASGRAGAVIDGLDRLIPFFGVSEEAMAHVLDEIETGRGSLERFLLDDLGVPRPHVQALRAALLA